MATSTSDDTEHEPAERHEPQRGRPFWELREDDKRVLFITILGALAANVGLVLIVGLGLVEAHLIHRFQHSLLTLFGPQLVVIFGTSMVPFVNALRSRRTPDDPIDRVFLAVAALLSAILILALAGYAAGIK
jgi:hypothetical protein